MVLEYGCDLIRHLMWYHYITDIKSGNTSNTVLPNLVHTFNYIGRMLPNLSHNIISKFVKVIINYLADTSSDNQSRAIRSHSKISTTCHYRGILLTFRIDELLSVRIVKTKCCPHTNFLIPCQVSESDGPDELVLYLFAAWIPGHNAGTAQRLACRWWHGLCGQLQL